MKKVLLIPAVLAPIVSSTPVIAAGDTGYTMNMNGMPMPSAQITPSAAQQVKTTNVAIQNFAFTPPSITVARGTAVTWTNQDSTAHTVTGNTSGGPSSSTIQPGQSYSFTFNAVGSFPYHCSIHPNMMGTVTVTGSTTSSGPSSTSTPPPTSSPKQKTASQLPNTGSANALALFAAASISGVGAYYLYSFLRKKSS